MNRKPGKASGLGYSFNIQDGADTSNMKEKKEYIRSMKNITRRVLILNVEGLFVHGIFKIISGLQGWVGDGNGGVHAIDGQINI